MIEGVKIKKINRYEDQRGWLGEIFRKDDVEYSPAMAYVSITKPGICRGPHEHKFQSDFFVFVGPGDFMLYLWDKNGKNLKIEVGEKNPTAIIVPPGIIHGYKCISENPGWVINLPDKLYRGHEKKEEIDEIRWEDDPNSPYKIN